MMAQNNLEERPFLSHIPEIYLQDTVLVGLTDVLERFYLHNESVIDALPDALYNPQNTPDALLDFLGNLVGLRNEHNLFLPSQMRALLPVAYRIQRKKGTRWAMLNMLEGYLASLCGHSVSPLIVEYDDWQGGVCAKIADAYPALYHTQKNEFTVLFPPEPLLQNPEEHARLSLLVSLYSPAVAIARIFVLKPHTDLDGYSYLGLNTYL